MPRATQKHIHLGATLDEHGAPTTVFFIKFPALDMTPRMSTAVDYALTGDAYAHRLVNSDGSPKKFVKDTLSLLCDETEYAALLDIAGKLVYYVPLEHAGDGEDHAPDRVQVFVSIRQGIGYVDPVLQYRVVTVILEEAAFSNEDCVLTLTHTEGTVVVAVKSGDITDFDALACKRGSVLSLLAIPPIGHAFSAWGDDAPAGHEQDNPLTLPMNENKTISAGYLP